MRAWKPGDKVSANRLEDMRKLLIQQLSVSGGLELRRCGNKLALSLNLAGLRRILKRVNGIGTVATEADLPEDVPAPSIYMTLDTYAYYVKRGGGVWFKFAPFTMPETITMEDVYAALYDYIPKAGTASAARHLAHSKYGFFGVGDGTESGGRDGVTYTRGSNGAREHELVFFK